MYRLNRNIKGHICDECIADDPTRYAEGEAWEILDVLTVEREPAHRCADCDSVFLPVPPARASITFTPAVELRIDLDVDVDAGAGKVFMDSLQAALDDTSLDRAWPLFDVAGSILTRREAQLWHLFLSRLPCHDCGALVMRNIEDSVDVRDIRTPAGDMERLVLIRNRDGSTTWTRSDLI